ncbi:MAG: GtrA family protein [Mucilaginibacter sp.]
MKKIHNKIRHAILKVIDFFYPLFKSIFPLQVFRYAACGGVNTFLDIFLFFISYNFVLHHNPVVLSFITISSPIAAFILGSSVSLPIGFYLNRYVVFTQSGLKKRHQLQRYLLVVLMCICLNYIFLKLFVEYMGWYPTIGKIATTFIVVVFSYTMQTFVFFKAKEVA